MNDREFAIAKIESKVLFMGIVPVKGETCLELCIGTHFFYVPIDPEQQWYLSCKSEIKYKTFKEFVIGEKLEEIWNITISNN